MTKVVLNRAYGGFSLTEEALHWLAKRGAFKTKEQRLEYHAIKEVFKYTRLASIFGSLGLRRDDPLLVLCVETLGIDSYATGSFLVVDDVKGTLGKDFRIVCDNGYETIKPITPGRRRSTSPCIRKWVRPF